MKRVPKIGVIGCGYWGPNLVRNFHALEGCELTHICDQDPRRLSHVKKLFPHVQAATRYEELVADPSLDALVVALPVKWHFEVARRALAAGKHVLIEKPMARSSAECAGLIELSVQNSLVLMVGHTFLYSSPVQKIKEIVQSGQLGDLCYINSRRLNLGIFQKDINVMWDLAPHDLSIILHVMDDHPLSVNCQGNANVTAGVEDVVNLSLNFRGGRFASVQNSWLDPRKVREITIVGTRKMIVYDDLQPLEKIKIYDVRVERPPYYDSFAEFQYSYHYGDMHVPYVRQEEPLKEQCRHFVECIQHGSIPRTGGAEGMELVQILEAASVSLTRNGAAVALSGGGMMEANPLLNAMETPAAAKSLSA